MNSSSFGRGESDRLARHSTSSAHLKGDAARRSTRRIVAAVLSPLVASVGLVGIASPAQAAVNPVTPPHDISVFPMRDFLGVGGWGVGAEMNVRVIRDGVQIGSAGPLTLAEDAELNGFAEVNHPGGFCWNGVTPNLIAGDRVEAVDADGDGEFVVVQNVEVTQPATKVDADGDGERDDVVARGMASNVEGTGRIDPSLVEQRVINPDLKDTTVGRRDVRAIFGDGLADGVETLGEIKWDNPADVTDPRWTATYLNLGGAVADLVEAGQSRMLAWERTDAAANRIGMTLWEYGEVGGPGMGGCPLGDNYAVGGATPKNINIATSQQADLTLSGTARNVDTVTVSVDDHDPATAPVTGTATVAKPTSLDPAVPMAGNTTWSATLPMEQLRTLDDDTLVASATFGLVQETQTLQDTDNDPTTEPVLAPFRASSGIGGADLNILKDLTAPQAPTAFPVGGRFDTAQSVTITANNEIEDVVRYRVGASEATTLDPTAASAVMPVPLPVTSTQTVKARSYDAAGNASAVSTFSYLITPDTVPGAPTGVSAVADDSTATVAWTPPTEDGGAAISSWRVQVFQGTATTPLRTVTVTDPNPTLVPGELSAAISGLTNGTEYRFRVAAFNGVGGTLQYSDLTAPVTPVGVTVEIPGAPTTVTAVAGDAQATVGWTAPEDDGGATISEYRIQVRTGTTVLRTITVAGTTSSTVVTGLTNGTAYTFRVRAVNLAGPGSLSPASAAVTPRPAVVTTVPGAPTIGTAVAGAAGGAITATANWAAPANNGGTQITGYVVRALRMSANGTVLQTINSAVRPATARSFAMALPQAGNYRFQVLAQNAVGQSAASARSNQVAGR